MFFFKTVQEIELQTAHIDKLDTEVEKTNAQLTNLNKRLKNILQKVKKYNNFKLL